MYNVVSHWGFIVWLNIMYIVFIFVGQVVGQLVDSLRYKPESCGFVCLPVGFQTVWSSSGFTGNGERLNAVVIDFSKAFGLFPHDWLFMIIANLGVDSRVIAEVREFVLGRTHWVRLRGQLSEDVRITSFVPQRSVLGPLLFLAYVNDIWRNIVLTVRLLADDCVIYKMIIISEDIENLQKVLDRLGEWVAGNAVKINPIKCKVFRFTRVRVEDQLIYTLGDQLILEASNCN